MKRPELMLSMALALLALPAFAAEPPAPGVLLDASELNAWTAQQRDGTAASPHRQTLSGKAMERAHERYLKSFEHPIPERFPRDSASTNAGSAQ